jgi:hypothetical protein
MLEQLCHWYQDHLGMQDLKGTILEIKVCTYFHCRENYCWHRLQKIQKLLLDTLGKKILSILVMMIPSTLVIECTVDGLLLVNTEGYTFVDS